MKDIILMACFFYRNARQAHGPNLQMRHSCDELLAPGNEKMYSAKGVGNLRYSESMLLKSRSGKMLYELADNGSI